MKTPTNNSVPKYLEMSLHIYPESITNAENAMKNMTICAYLAKTSNTGKYFSKVYNKILTDKTYRGSNKI